MPRLKDYQRVRLIELFDDKIRHLKKFRIKKLQELAKTENIIISTKSLRKIINIWLKNNSMFPLESPTRRLKKTKITCNQLNKIDKLVLQNRELTRLQIRNQLRLNVSQRSVSRYLNILGWRKIKSRLIFWN